MRIISWNVNGLRARLDSGGFRPVLRLDPDILCIQETKMGAAPAVIEGFDHRFNTAERRGYSGTMTDSRIEPLAVRMGFGMPELDTEGRAITHEYRGFYLVNVYVPASKGDLRRRDYRVRWGRALVDHAARLSRMAPVIICGDMNAPLEIDDVYEENIHHGEEVEGFASDERDLLLDLLGKGFVDAFRLKNPGAKDAFTWWSNRRKKRDDNRGWRLDYFLCSDCLADRIEKVEHLTGIMGSDHCPIMMDIAL